jgi:hypothetical protein
MKTKTLKPLDRSSTTKTGMVLGDLFPDNTFITIFRDISAK